MLPSPTNWQRDLAIEEIQPLIIRTDEFAPLSFNDLLADVPLDRRTLIVFAAGVNRQPAAGWSRLADFPSVALLLQLAPTLQNRDAAASLYILSNGAAGVPGDEHLDLGQATLHGIAQAGLIKNECVSMPVTTIDLSDAVSPGDVDALMNELLHIRVDCDESEIACAAASVLCGN